jgi:purine-nucleoside phosphorylase
MGMRVLGLNAVTDECLPDALTPASVEEILEAAGAIEPRLTSLVAKVVPRL